MLTKTNQMNNNWYVYRHTRLDKNEPFYIGIGCQPDHKRAYSVKGRNDIWIRISRKTKYDIDILLDGITFEQACEKEVELIKLYGRINLNNGTLCNMTDGGDGIAGLKHSPESIVKMRLSKTGDAHPMFGMEHSLETKDKMRIAALGRKKSPEEIAKIVAGNIGKKQSSETILKMKAAKSGSNNPSYGKKQSPDRIAKRVATRAANRTIKIAQ